LQITDGRLLLPGGPQANAIWEALVGVSPARTGPFLRALVTKDNGRLAWYYDTIGGLDAGDLAATWPTTRQLERASALYASFRDPDPQWRVGDQPFRRNHIDAWMLVTQNLVAKDMVASVLPQQTWALLFANERVNHEQVTRTLKGTRNGVPMAWLARETLSPVVRERRNRYEMFRLAQRVFADAPATALADVAVALSGIRRSRALLLTLERTACVGPGLSGDARSARAHEACAHTGCCHGHPPRALAQRRCASRQACAALAHQVDCRKVGAGAAAARAARRVDGQDRI
jgi:hypothetical protein